MHSLEKIIEIVNQQFNKNVENLVKQIYKIFSKWRKLNMRLPRQITWFLMLIFCSMFYVFGQKGDYLILVPNAIYNGPAKSQIDAFKAHKQTRGFNVAIITEDRWGGGTGDAGATKIRDWLKTNEYEEKFILIIGDPDKSSDPSPSLVPMLNSRSGRGIGGVSAITPTDFYYADLDGNWDASVSLS